MESRLVKEKELFFDNIVKERLDKINYILAIKAKEYRRNKNPFHNFEKGAVLEQKTPFEILHGMFLKHYISYLDILEDYKENNFHSNAFIDEKLGDLINYLILQEAQLKWKNKN